MNSCSCGVDKNGTITITDHDHVLLSKQLRDYRISRNTERQELKKNLRWMMIQYQAINNNLMCCIQSTLGRWLPGGHIAAGEYVALNPNRSDKTAGSFRVNLRTGKWADFATNDKGRDLISLYAYLNNITNSDAARELSITCQI